MSSKLIAGLKNEGGRSVTAPPDGQQNVARPIPIPAGLRMHGRVSSDPYPKDRGETPQSTSLDLMATLQRSEASVVKTRTGSVLSRGFILKTDHYPSGMNRTIVCLMSGLILC